MGSIRRGVPSTISRREMHFICARKKRCKWCTLFGVTLAPRIFIRGTFMPAKCLIITIYRGYECENNQRGITASPLNHYRLRAGFSRGSSSGNNGERGENRAEERKRRSVSTYVGSLRCVLGYWVSFYHASVDFVSCCDRLRLRAPAAENNLSRINVV